MHISRVWTSIKSRGFAVTRRKRLGLSQREYALAVAVAKSVGQTDGREASLEAYAALSRGFSDDAMRKYYAQDPALLLPVLDLSGQWAGIFTAADIYAGILRSIDRELTLETQQDLDSVVDVYEEAWLASSVKTMEERLGI